VRGSQLKPHGRPEAAAAQRNTGESCGRPQKAGHSLCFTKTDRAHRPVWNLEICSFNSVKLSQVVPQRSWIWTS
jgi:hypothetical protein